MLLAGNLSAQRSATRGGARVESEKVDARDREIEKEREKERQRDTEKEEEDDSVGAPATLHTCYAGGYTAAMQVEGSGLRI